MRAHRKCIQRNEAIYLIRVDPQKDECRKERRNESKERRKKVIKKNERTEDGRKGKEESRPVKKDRGALLARG